MKHALARLLLTAALGTATALPVVHADTQADEQAVRQALAKYMPSLPVDSIAPAPIPGFFQVVSNGQVAYVSKDGRYLLAGNLLDLRDQVNLTAQVRDKLRLKTLTAVPASHKLIFPAKGQKKHTITVLTDPTCPYCEKLHHEIPALQQAGIEVQYILTPREGKNSRGYTESSQIMCSKDSKQMLATAMARKPISGDACKNDVIDANLKLSDKLGMSGTPYIVMPDGSAVPGYRPAQVLIKALGQ